MIERECPCGTRFKTTQKRFDEGRGRFCSKRCMYQHRKPRPSGLTYNIVAQNRAWFPKGHLPANAGTAKPKVRKGRPLGERHHAWKGDDASYVSFHKWVRYHRGDPSRAKCALCGFPANQWSNISGEYLRDLTDWWALCYSCHQDYDKTNIPGAMARKFAR